jgi:uncharacterized RDD family membrane protein YckC
MDMSEPVNPVNPFAPPKTDIAAVPLEQDQFTDATMGVRFLNFLLDNVARLLLSAVLGGIFGALGGSSTFGNIFISLSIMLGYYMFFEGVFGRSPGKLLTGTYVVNEDGTKPRFSQIVGRSLARFVPFEPLSFFGNSPTGWHDRWSGTRVVKIRKA